MNSNVTMNALFFFSFLSISPNKMVLFVGNVSSLTCTFGTHCRFRRDEREGEGIGQSAPGPRCLQGPGVMTYFEKEY